LFYTIILIVAKVLVVGDTHGEFELIQDIIKNVKPDVVVHTGDYGSLKEKNNDPFFKVDKDLIKSTLCYWVDGNHDFMAKYGFKKSEKYFEDFICKSYKVFEIEGVKIFVSHFVDDTRKDVAFGNGRTYIKTEQFHKWFEDLLLKENPHLILAGHTHVAKYWHIDKFLALNPGSLTHPKFPQDQGSYATLIIDGGEIKEVNIKFL